MFLFVVSVAFRKGEKCYNSQKLYIWNRKCILGKGQVTENSQCPFRENRPLFSSMLCTCMRTCDELSCYIRDEPSTRMKIRQRIIFAWVHVALTFTWRTAEPWPNPRRAALLNRAVYGGVYHSAAPYTPPNATSERICTSLPRSGNEGTITTHRPPLRWCSVGVRKLSR